MWSAADRTRCVAFLAVALYKLLVTWSVSDTRKSASRTLLFFVFPAGIRPRSIPDPGPPPPLVNVPGTAAAASRVTVSTVAPPPPPAPPLPRPSTPGQTAPGAPPAHAQSVPRVNVPVLPMPRSDSNALRAKHFDLTTLQIGSFSVRCVSIGLVES